MCLGDAMIDSLLMELDACDDQPDRSLSYYIKKSVLSSKEEKKEFGFI